MTIYKQLIYEQSCQIYTLKKRGGGDSQRTIAKVVGVSQPTISRELSRNSGERGYRFKQAHDKADQRRQEAIYKHIWADKQAGGDLYKHLRRQGKKYNKRRHGKSTRGQIKGRVSIDDRPNIVDDKARVGDWEIDTIIGKGHSGALVTVAERVTNFTVAAQLDSKSAENVAQATIELLKPFQSLVHTITADNGKEFAYHAQISKALDAEVYFAHPYSSWERGLNENTNGLLRQYFPKETDLKKIRQEQVDCAVVKLNAKPRKGLEFIMPKQLMDYSLNKAA